MQFFDIHSVFVRILGYDLSYLEFTAVVAGFVAVWLSAKANIWSWPVGIVNVVLAAIFYYQIQFYPDMFLQFFFFVTNILGWWRWAHPASHEADAKKELRVSHMSWKNIVIVSATGVSGTLIMGLMASNLHRWFPVLFNLPSAFPYADSFILVMSIVTTFYMIQKKIENWVVWIIVDLLATYLYYIKGALFFSLEYFVFTGLAAYGWYHWSQEYRHYQIIQTDSKS